MKMAIGFHAAQAVLPDYALLKTALIAAQAATPTARACALAAPRRDPRVALHALFAATAPASPAGSAAALGNSFSRIVPRDGEPA